MNDDRLVDLAQRLSVTLTAGDLDHTLSRITAAAVEALPEVDYASTSSRANKVTISFATVVDLDNTVLTYTLYRGTTRIGSWSRYSYPWTNPTTVTTTDTGLSSRQTLAYHVEVTDGRNLTKGKAATVKVR